MDYRKFKAPYLRRAQIWEKADALRSRFPSCARLPVPVLDLAEFDLGLELVPKARLRQAGDIESLLLGDLKTIYVDRDAFLDPRSENRLRFSVAHELGHLGLRQPRISIALPAIPVLPSRTKAMTLTRNTVVLTAENAENSSAFHEEHLAFNAPVLTCRQRADRLKKQHVAFFKFFAPEAREILNDLLEKYASDGELQLVAVRKHLPDVLKVRPISDHGNVNQIIGKFGGADQLRNAVNQLQSLLYAA